MGGEVGANLQKVFAYGIRNTFGMAFDPKSGDLWLEENDSFAQVSRIRPGQNSGWVQLRGPASRIAEYKAIETSPASDPCIGGASFGLQQIRWPPTNLADTPEQALSRLFMLPGSSGPRRDARLVDRVGAGHRTPVDGDALEGLGQGGLGRLQYFTRPGGSSRARDRPETGARRRT